jgi:hypothetical protein
MACPRRLRRHNPVRRRELPFRLRCEPCRSDLHVGSLLGVLSDTPELERQLLELLLLAYLRDDRLLNLLLRRPSELPGRRCGTREGTLNGGAVADDL